VQGVVQLSGFVSSADSVAAAASVARTVKGVKSVRNDLRLK
jgi:hyperosmotically inducible protein